jgi:pimeloyl-ACP methyl ester carboxylesterase
MQALHIDQYGPVTALTVRDVPRPACAQFLAFPTGVQDNQAAMATQLPMPVLAIGDAQSFGTTQAVVMRHAATQVTEVVIPHAGHWLMGEEPAATMTAIRTFLDAKHVEVEP